MHFFDTHIHLTDFENVTPEALMKKLHRANIQKCVCVSSKLSDAEAVASFAHSFPFDVIPSFGVHPWYCDKVKEDFIDQLSYQLQMFPEAAVGECGFDRLKGPLFEIQKKVFDAQIELAFKFQRPLIIHAVKADVWLETYFERLPEKSVFHSFSGSVELLKKIMKFGFYISINQKFFNKKDAEKIIKNTPKDKLLIETDAPFQAEPESLSEVVEKIAGIYHSDVIDVAQTLYLNAMNVFLGD